MSGSAESGVSGVCIICNIEEPTDNTLLGGLRFHRGCYDRLQQRANALGLIQGQLRAELDNPYSLAQRVMLILSRRRRQRAERAREMLFGLLDQSVADLKLLNAIVSKIHDVWIGLPPDWHERRRAIRSRDKNSCAECGVGGQLHLHHRKPIRLGGTHNLENLVLLCAASSETLVRSIRRKHHAAEEKIRIVLDGLRRETSIAELCRREGIAESMCITLGRRINGRRSILRNESNCVCGSIFIG